MDRISVLKKQSDLLAAMLDLNSEWTPDWKFLIYDEIGQDIIGPLVSVDKLKSQNITGHFMLRSPREAVPEVSAIYFVMPSDHNIERICSDIKEHLYESYYLNFISPLPRSKLESIADAALLSDCAHSIKKVYDQYSNFIALEDDLFILRENCKNSISFHEIYRRDATEAEITNVLDNIVDGLFSVLVTLTIVPIIRSNQGGPSEIVAEKLSKKIRDTIRDNRNGLFNSNDPFLSTFQRPLLCLVDRDIDMSTPLHHTWTYQALIHDLLNFELNKVTLREEKEKSKPKVKLFELNSKDRFWADQRGSPFPQVAEAVQRELDEYKKREDELNSLKTSMGFDGPTDELSIAESTARLTHAARTLPELSQNKQIITMHTSIATDVLNEIKARKLDNFFELEEKIMNRSPIDRTALDDMITNPNYGQPDDKYRLFLISYIYDNPNLTEDEFEQYVKILESFDCSRAAYEYVKRWKTLSKSNVATLQSSMKSSGGLLRTAGMFTKLMSQGSQFVMEGVKNLVLKEHHLPLTKIIDGLMDSSSRASRESLEYTYHDPLAKGSDVQRKKVFQEAIVFVVGGGNYIEFQNLVDYSRSKSRNSTGPHGSRHVIYGSTELMSASRFLKQLQQLGNMGD